MKNILKNLNKIIKKINWKQFKNKINKQTLKIHPKNPGDTIVNPPSFPQIQNYFGVWGHNSVPPH